MSSDGSQTDQPTGYQLQDPDYLANRLRSNWTFHTVDFSKDSITSGNPAGVPSFQGSQSWHVVDTSVGRVQNLGSILPGLTQSDSLCLTNACAAAARAASASKPTTSAALANAFVGAAPLDFWDKLWDAVKGVMTDSFWPDLSSSQKDPVTGGQASIAKIQHSGAVDWLSTDGLMAGSALPPIVVHQSKFVNGPDVTVSIAPYVRRDAIPANKPNLFLGGGAVSVEGETSDGRPWSVGGGGGVNSAAGLAVGITIRYGPNAEP